MFMLKWAVVGGALAVLGYSGIGLGSLVASVFAVALGFLCLAIVLQVAAVVLEKITRRSFGVPLQGSSERMSGSRSLV